MNTSTQARRNKHLILDQSRLERAKKILGVSTETETVKIALERVISEAETDRKTAASHDKFVRAMISGKIVIKDVFGNLEK